MKLQQKLIVKETSIREQIIAELINRLNASFASTPIMRGFGNLQGLPNCPVFVLLEEPEKLAKVKRGVYQKELPITIILYLQVSDAAIMYETANVELASIVTAVETDERFNDLTVKYSAAENSIDPFAGNIVGVAITYKFEYIENLLGVK